MRKIEKEIVNALKNNQTVTLSKRDRVEYELLSTPNSPETIEINRYYLWGHLVAYVTVTNLNRTLTLSSCRHETNTTKSRLNAILHGLGFKYTIYQEKYVWYIMNYETREKREFKSGMTLEWGK